ncbi:MAG: hypothetical protein U9N30_04895 [Campylobacterota bacterium]|nr:hypothetical protein [Campylobacterota bacterium]
MQDSLCKYGQRVIAFLIIITLIMNWRMFSIIGGFGLTFTNNLLIIAWAILLFVAAVGLFLKRTWGLFFYYPAAFLTTVGFSIPMVPFVTDLFPSEISPWVMIGINSIMLIIVIWIHWAKSKHFTNEITKKEVNLKC